MKALRFHKARDLRLDDVPPPAEPGPGDVVMKIHHCGICGTDLHEYLDGPIILPVEPHSFTGAQIPVILGHEFSATVTAVGSGVTNVQPGDRVAVIPHLNKPGEYYARRNLGQYSPETGIVGLTWHWGGMGEYALIPHQNVVRLPDTVSNIQGAVVEPASVALNAIDAGGVVVGSTVLVTGAGPIGALTAMCAVAAGASRVYLFEPNAGRRARVEALGGIAVFGDVEGLRDTIRGETDNGVGVDVAIECAGHEAALDLCLDLVKRTGTLAQVGLFVGKPAVDMFKVCEKGIRIVGSWGCDLTVGPRLVSMIASGRFPVEKIVTGRVSLDDAVRLGFDELVKKGNDHLKVLIDVSP